MTFSETGVVVTGWTLKYPTDAVYIFAAGCAWWKRVVGGGGGATAEEIT